MKYNILVSCDQTYYDRWAIPLLKSIHSYSPNISLHCHIVNPTKKNISNFADITTEQKDFVSEENKIAYLQCARFLTVAKKFSNNENVITLDADTICTRSLDNINVLFDKQYVLKHYKEDRWLAGFVVFNDNSFRQEYANELNLSQFRTWKWGRDQLILNKMSKDYNFIELPREWMSIGKNKTNSIFLTLKGDQKVKEKYLNGYKKYLN